MLWISILSVRCFLSTCLVPPVGLSALEVREHVTPVPSCPQRQRLHCWIITSVLQQFGCEDRATYSCLPGSLARNLGWMYGHTFLLGLCG